MEGPLSKWTNVMKGWQYRWFVLDDSAGLLSYYTSKEKMVRGARRGCVRLKGAIVGIDDDDDSTFTVTVDSKTFHFQAHDSEEREKWIRALEDTILRHAPSLRRWDANRPPPTMDDFDKKLTESDVYLQLLIEQTKTLERYISETSTGLEDRERSENVLQEANNILEAIKHSIVLLQIAKNTAFPINGVYHPCNSPPNSSVTLGLPGLTGHGGDLGPGISVVPAVQTGIEMGKECAELGGGGQSFLANRLGSPVCLMPETSYSSSDDDDFFDADDFASVHSQSSNGGRIYEDTMSSPIASGDEMRSPVGGTLRPVYSPSSLSYTSYSQGADLTQESQGRNLALDYDALYEEDDDEDFGSMESHGSIIHHLLSQVKIGMDLTKVVLPTFILERRSLLEMYADFFAHPDLFCSIADQNDPRERMVQVVKWYLSAFHAGRKSEVAKKPYNPILGEIFRCYWDVPGEPTCTMQVPDGPVPWASTRQLSFVAEQVSHHPPVSAFYAEHKDKGIAFCGHIWTKSKFLGLSIGVHNIGQGCVSLLEHDEEYIVNFPSGYGRSILTVPWVELGGNCQISCSKTGYVANVEFLTKPFYGGKKHKVSGEVFSAGEKKPFLTIDGEWNGVMHAKCNDGKTEVFVDTKSMEIVRKNVKGIAEQTANESRFIWRDVTAGLKFNSIEQATAAKLTIEQKQRTEAKQRRESEIKWETSLFALAGDNWLYNNPLQKRESV